MKVTQRVSGFLKQFGGPGDNCIVCFRFWQAVIASGCPGECAYCFLQTQTPYRRGLYDLKGTLFENLRDMVPETEQWLRQSMPASLIMGENQDGLAFERPYKHLLGVTPLELLVPLFRDANPVGHTLIILSKFTTTEYAEVFGPCPHVVFSWSLSLPTISERFERKVAPLARRLDAARRLKEKGWRIRFRLDALAPIAGWQAEIEDIVGRINEIGPEMLTLGVVRATNGATLRRAAVANGRDGHIFDYLQEKDLSGFKYRVAPDFQVEAYQRVAELLSNETRLGLCKEDAEVWSAAKIQWRGCHCLNGSSEEVVRERGNPDQLLLDLQRRRSFVTLPVV